MNTTLVEALARSAGGESLIDAYFISKQSSKLPIFLFRLKMLSTSVVFVWLCGCLVYRCPTPVPTYAPFYTDSDTPSVTPSVTPSASSPSGDDDPDDWVVLFYVAQIVGNISYVDFTVLYDTNTRVMRDTVASSIGT